MTRSVGTHRSATTDRPIRGSGVLTVQASGLGVTLQDLGRPGYAHLGVGRSGTMDVPAARLANRLVGNPEGAVLIERVTLGPPVVFDITAPVTFAATGAPTELVIDGVRHSAFAAVTAHAGARVHWLHRDAGMYAYLAVSGGLEPERVLGSASTDTLSGIGPAPLRAGVRIPLGHAPRAYEPVDVAHPPATPDGPVTLRVVRGPRAYWFADSTVLAENTWTVTPASNRVGIRLAGPPLSRSQVGELPSEGVALGSLQVPPDGRPILFTADHPVTGGYPVAGVVVAADLPKAVQARVGEALRFRFVDVAW